MDQHPHVDSMSSGETGGNAGMDLPRTISHLSDAAPVTDDGGRPSVEEDMQNRPNADPLSNWKPGDPVPETPHLGSPGTTESPTTAQVEAPASSSQSTPETPPNGVESTSVSAASHTEAPMLPGDPIPTAPIHNETSTLQPSAVTNAETNEAKSPASAEVETPAEPQSAHAALKAAYGEGTESKSNIPNLEPSSLDEQPGTAVTGHTAQALADQELQAAYNAHGQETVDDAIAAKNPNDELVSHDQALFEANRVHTRLRSMDEKLATSGLHELAGASKANDAAAAAASHPETEAELEDEARYHYAAAGEADKAAHHEYLKAHGESDEAGQDYRQRSTPEVADAQNRLEVIRAVVKDLDAARDKLQQEIDSLEHEANRGSVDA